MSYAQFVNQERTRRIGGGSAAAFLYRTGGTGIGLEGMTATRADSTTCARYQDASGIWQLAPANVLRSSHYIGGIITTLREGAGTNSALHSADFTDAAWVGGGSFTLAAATSCLAGQSATKHTDAAGGAVRTQNVGIFVNGQTDCEWYILEDTGDGNAASDITLYDATVSAALYTARVTWATKTIATTAGTGSCGIINDGNGHYRCYIAAAGVAAGAVAGGAGNTRQLRIAPVITAGKSCIIHQGELEATVAVPSSPIVTVAGAVTRAADLISVPWTRTPEAGTWYVDAYDLKGVVNCEAIHIGANNVSTAQSGDIYRNSSDKWTGYINTAAGNSLSSVAASAAFGDRAELRNVFAVSGGNVTARIGQALNGGTEAVAAAGSARTLDATWAGNTLYIGSLGTGASYHANLAIRSLCYVPGPETSQATMRQIVSS